MFFLFLVWANLHPSFAFGLALIVVYVATLLGWEWLVGGEKGGLLRASATIIAALAGSLCNPYGWRLHQSIFVLGSSKFFMRLHQEWMPLDILEPEGFFFVLFASVILVGSWIRASKGENVRAEGVAEAVLLAVTARAGFAHLRMIPYFFIFAAPLVASSIRIVGEATAKVLSRTVPGLGERFRMREQFEASRASPALLALVLFVVCIGSIPFDRVAGFPTTRAEQEVVREGGRALPARQLSIPLGPPAAQYPYRALDYLTSVTKTIRASADRRDKPIIVLNPPDWGGFIALKGEGFIKPLFDDRNTMLGESRYLSFLRIANDCGALMRLAQELGADFVLIPAGNLKAGGCILAGVPEDTVAMNERGTVCQQSEPCYAESVPFQRPNYRDAVAAIFRVPARMPAGHPPL